MASFNLVNYSLRPSKSIQRSLVFEGVRKLQAAMDLENLMFIGLGSIWFTDFQMAHKTVGIREMISIEADDIGYTRAQFNRPFKTVRVEKGMSNEVLPKLLHEEKLLKFPWLVWLDYDKTLDEDKVEDIRRVIESAPQNSILLVTLNAEGRKFGKPIHRVERLRTLLGAVVPMNLSRDDCDERLPETMADLIGKFMNSVAFRAGRPGGFWLGFKLVYCDSSTMITVGGVLPKKGSVPAAREAINENDWRCLDTDRIVAPNLTFKEIAVLQAELPSPALLSRSMVRDLGFDLDDDQIKAFERYYRYYPAFAQIMG